MKHESKMRCYCENCKAEQPYITKSSIEYAQYGSREIPYKVKIAHCKQCDSVLVVHELEEENRLSKELAVQYVLDPKSLNTRFQGKLG